MVVETLMVMVALYGQSPAERSADRGVIAGMVLNASDGDKPVPSAEVVLQVRRGNESAIVAETVADARGGYTFSRLPLGSDRIYTPGANRQGIHYPGPAVQLTLQRCEAIASLSVCDTIAAPSPLVLRRHDIRLKPKPGSLEVTETLLIDNPSKTCYVGVSSQDGAEPITLQLAIPQDFQRATFDKEFFGRRFVVHNGKLATGIPWTPGQREVKLTYVVPNRRRYLRFERPMDLPCNELRLSVAHADPDAVSCNLTRRETSGGEVVFESDGAALPSGRVIQVAIGRAPVPAMAYARWGALVILGVLVAAGIWQVRRRQTTTPATPPRGASRRRAGRKASKVVTIHASHHHAAPSLPSEAAPPVSVAREERSKSP